MTMRSSKCEKGYIAPHILIDQLTEKKFSNTGRHCQIS